MGKPPIAWIHHLFSIIMGILCFFLTVAYTFLILSSPPTNNNIACLLCAKHIMLSSHPSSEAGLAICVPILQTQTWSSNKLKYLLQDQ